jgi:hypothetical protein
MLAELTEKRRKEGLEKSSKDGIERKRRVKTLDSSLIEVSLRGIAEVESESSVRRISL